jgi:hypothetical protein
MKKKAQKKPVMKVQIEENVAFDNLVNSYLSDFIFEGLNGSVTGNEPEIKDVNDFKNKTLEKAKKKVATMNPAAFDKAKKAANEVGAKLSV